MSKRCSTPAAPSASASARELVEAAEKLLEWTPTCSKGSSGDLRAERVRKAVARVREQLLID